MESLKDDHSDHSNISSDLNSDDEGDHVMLFPITDVDVDASCESLADQRSSVHHRERRESEDEPVKAFITLRERRLLKVMYIYL